MICMKRYAIILWFMLTVLSGFSQNYVGTVVNKDSGKTIDGVSLCILSSDSLIISYAITDKNGKGT